MSQGWDAIPEGKNSKGGNSSKSTYNNDLFFKMKTGTYKIRLIGKSPHSMNIAWVPSPYKDKDGKKSKNKIKVVVPDAYVDRLKSMNIIPRENYAMLCFDRADTAAGTTRLKIFEKGPKIFREFKTWGEARSTEGAILSPGDPAKGPDWFIKAIVPESDPMSATYSITPLDPTPITKAEAELLKRDPSQHQDKPLGERGPINLKEYYKAEEEKGAKILEAFFKSNSSLDETQSVDDFIGKSDKSESLDDLPSFDDDDSEDAKSVAESVRSIF